MAFLKYAYAKSVQHHVRQARWKKIRTASGPSRDILGQATRILGERLDPDRFLLTHATIVCSVDTQKAEDKDAMKLGSVIDPMTGKRIQRKWGDFRVHPHCDPYINNNHDAWSRPVLAKSYPTFIGGHNFVEHVQKLEESKGRIIDAVSRDIGDSLYVDILIATDKRHTALVNDIEAGRMDTLSMGCSVTETICTKCGNVAADETQMCHHIRYEKGNYFLDERGQRHRIAELCGHESLNPNAGVHFIEASWVATPAFGGAVMRNILRPGEVSPETLARTAEVLSSPPKQWVGDGVPKAANRLVQVPVSDRGVVAPFGGGPVNGGYDSLDEDQGVIGFDFSDEGEGEEDKPKPPKAKPFDQLTDDVFQQVLDKVNQKVRDELEGRGEKGSKPEPAHSTGEDIIKQAYQQGVQSLVKTAKSDAHLMDSLARWNARMGMKIPRPLYLAALEVGPTQKYGSIEKWAVACHRALKRSPSLTEAKAMMRLGRLLDQWSALHSNQL